MLVTQNKKELSLFTAQNEFNTMQKIIQIMMKNISGFKMY